MMDADKINARALDIAAKIMAAAGLCRYENQAKCRRLSANNEICADCIRSWAKNRARQELREEGHHD